MDKKQKQEYFDKLHIQIAQKYNTSPSVINHIRSASLRDNQSLKEIAMNAVFKRSLPRYNIKLKKKKKVTAGTHRKRSKKYYQDIINFVATLKQEDFIDITKKI